MVLPVCCAVNLWTLMTYAQRHRAETNALFWQPGWQREDAETEQQEAGGKQVSIPPPTPDPQMLSVSVSSQHSSARNGNKSNTASFTERILLHQPLETVHLTPLFIVYFGSGLAELLTQLKISEVSYTMYGRPIFPTCYYQWQCNSYVTPEVPKD